MKKFVIIGVISVILIVGAGGAYFLFGNTSSLSSSQTGINTTATGPATAIEACGILTEKIARETIGDDLSESDPSSGDAVSGDLSVTNCSYSTTLDTTSVPPKISSVSLLVRSSTTHAGGESNRQAFTAARPGDAQSVDGIGDQAFYSPQFRQLNMLKGSNWYILMSYKDSITNSTLESNKSLAEKLELQ